MKLMKFMAAVTVGALLAGCSDPTTAIRAAEDVGVSNVKPTGYRWFGCGKDDTFSTGFEGTSIKGKPVSGVVCSGWFKGATVRFD